jgi:DNA-binding LytR/AlgR family response regulator
MAQIEILVLEDDKFDADILVGELNRNFITHLANSVEEAKELFQSKSIDLAILDIYINGHPDGLKVAQFINENALEEKCPVIFLTSSQDRRVFDQATKKLPANFLIKPFNGLELMYSIELAIERSVEENFNFSWVSSNGAVLMNHNFLIKKRDSWIKVAPSQIIYIEVDARYCNLKTDNGDFLIQSSLTKLLANLDETIFVKTHRNYAANLNRVKEYLPENNIIVMDNDHSVFLSSRLKESFLKCYQLLK